MARRDLTFRVFVSSTFSDLVAERSALQEHVFPRLREFCRKHGARFQATDLRWGISNEAALDQSTMRICRAEIACGQAVTPRPNFVFLQDRDRHGWRLLSDEIPDTESGTLLPHPSTELASRWYGLDENPVCPVPNVIWLDEGRCILRPCTGEYTDCDKWCDEVGGPLRDTFRLASRDLDLPEHARWKYEASATARETHYGALAMPDASEHTMVCIRVIRAADSLTSSVNCLSCSSHGWIGAPAHDPTTEV
jgi:hypothetical protein